MLQTRQQNSDDDDFVMNDSSVMTRGEISDDDG